jgi:hypothetical protein
MTLMLNSVAQAEAPPTSALGAHGMAIFGGRDALYASHLPMFHAPHDSQVLLRFHLKDAAIDPQLRQALAQKVALWTLDPEEFDLLRLAAAHPQRLRQFTARLVQGHFERGGTEAWSGQTVVVEEVLLFRRLSPKSEKHTAGNYHVLGNAPEQFLVKEIDRRPDFDVIMALTPSSTQTAALPKMLKIAGDDLKPPNAQMWQAALQALGRQAESEVSLGATLYFETEDLK